MSRTSRGYAATRWTSWTEPASERLKPANAAEALVLLETNIVDTLFTDTDMPGSMDGLGLVATVRSRWPSIRIIVTSGLIKFARRDPRNEMAFMSEPTTRLELINLISRSR
ncbi:response regulator [Rhizobium sp. AN80A]|uniref:response regulator n=1 Tax=Rhizobium sp. AN80A TaxID=3040673 RepID=UPI000DDAF534